MKIRLKGKTFSFECPCCGCDFEVGEKDPQLERDNSVCVGRKETATIYCKCPCCDERVRSVINVTVMDGGYTRIESQEKQAP